MTKFIIKPKSTNSLQNSKLIGSVVPVSLPTSIRSGVWDLFRDGLTQGLLGAFSTCPEKVRLGYVEGLSERRSSSAMEFGNIIHDTLDLVYSAFLNPEKAPGYAFIFKEGLEKDWDIAIERIHKILKYKEAEDRKLLSDLKFKAVDGEISIEENYGKAAALLPAYVRRWKSDFDRKLTDWKVLEGQFDFKDGQKGQINQGSNYDPFDDRIRVRGKWDGVFRSPTGKLWLLETKTKGRINEADIMDMLNIDLQVGLYLYAIWMVYGEVPGGVYYNVIRTPQLRQKKTETLAEFIKRVDKDLADRPEHYFYRYQASITQKDLEAFRENFKPQVDRLVEWVRGASHYRNTKACTLGGISCRFLPICSRGDRSRFVTRTEPFAELTDDLVE